MIPPEKSDAVSRGLREAFGVAEFDGIRMIKDQALSLVFRIVVGGLPFLLKISGRTNDPARHYACMRAAAEAGLAPRVLYTSVEDKLSIEDFVEARPFPAAEALVRLPAALRRLHALPPFPGVPDHINTSCVFLINKGAALDGFLQRFQAANILEKGESEELFARYAQIVAAYPHHDADFVSSHNDLFKPDNFVFDGQRVWLVDWEAAFRNDRYADLAVVANLVVANEAEESLYLQEYFGASPDAYQLARFFLMRQVSHMFYAMAFLQMGSPVDWNETVPEFPELQRRFWAGELTLEDKHSRTVYGRLHWDRLLRNTRQARFNEALRIVSDRHAPV
ncbi:MAG TPA: phosphotransferase [Bryobacteraceae bacterium]|nr:phosphotransferase [Bryobacteraceae bacterium]